MGSTTSRETEFYATACFYGKKAKNQLTHSK